MADLRIIPLMLISILAGCAGGGGGGGSGSSGNQPPGNSNPPPTTDPTALNIYRQNSNSAIYANAINYQSISSGAGQTVAVFDSGVAPHPALSVNLLSGINCASSTSCSAGNWFPTNNDHGTAVAGVIAANPVAGNLNSFYGVAPSASIFPVRIADNNNTMYDTYVVTALNYFAATPSAPKIINMSFGNDTGAASLANALTTNVNAGRLIIASAGNDGHANPTYPARYGKEAWAHGQILAVGSIDQNYNISSFSNRAGDTKDFYLVALGEGVHTINSSNDFITWSGTSFAAPSVSGAAAVVWSRWPSLSAAQVAQILLTTATDLGAPGVDDIYGHGLVNVGAALQPVAPASVTTPSGKQVSPSSVVTPSLPAASKAMREAAAQGAFDTMLTDKFGRGFRVESASASPAPNNAVQVLKAAKTDGLQTKAHLNSFTVTYSAAGAGFDASQGFSLQYNSDRFGFALGTDARASSFFSLAGSIANPYFDVVSNHRYAGAFTRFGDWSVKTGFLSGMNDAYSNSANKGEGKSALDVMVTREFSTGTVSLMAGRLSEIESLLGGTSTDAFAFSNKAIATDFVGLGASKRLTGPWSMSAQALVGRTAGQNSDGQSLIASVSPLTSLSAMLALSSQNFWTSNDEFTLSYGLPLQIRRGSITVTAPYEQDLEGNTVYRTTDVNLGGDSWITALAMNYRVPLRGGAKFGMKAEYRRQNGEPSRTSFGVAYTTPF